MKRTLAQLFAGILLCHSTPCLAQYVPRQIDSLLDVANHLSDYKQKIELANIAYQKSKNIRYPTGMVRALLTRAVTYSNMRRYEDAFKYAVQAEDEVNRLNNPRYIAALEAIKGMSYTNLGFFNDGEETLRSAIPIAEKIEDPDQRHNRLGNIYAALIENNELSKGNAGKRSFYNRKSFQEFMQIKVKNKFGNVVALPTYNLGDFFLTIKQYDSAAYYLNKAVKLADQYQENIAAAYAFNDLGLLYYEKKSYSTAAGYYQKGITAFAILKNASQLRDAYVGLSRVYTALNKNQDAQKYLERSMELTDSLTSVEKNAIKTPLGYILKYKERQLAVNKSRNFRIISFTAVLLLAGIGVIFFYSSRFKKEQRLSQQRLNELVQKIELNHQSHSPSKTEKLKEVIQLAVNNNPAFFLKFNEFDPKFNKKLLEIAPHLVATEIEFCAFLRLNFETKEIARYTKTSVRAVEGKKYRIRKKLRLQTDQDINIWMSNI